MTDRRVYLYALAPAAVVLATGPALAWAAPAGPALGPVRLLGLVPLVGGLALALWAVHTFAAAGQDPSPAAVPEELVTDGPLAHVRNPVYLGTVLAAGGEALLLASPAVGAYAAALWVAYHLLVVAYEEPALAAAFGDDYERYRERVPRWLPRPWTWAWR